jgi:hypothetical protein
VRTIPILSPLFFKQPPNHHVFALNHHVLTTILQLKIVSFRLRKHEDFRLEPPRNRSKTQNSPQLTTNPEVQFFPQVIGPTTAIDLSPPKNIQKQKTIAKATARKLLKKSVLLKGTAGSPRL